MSKDRKRDESESQVKIKEMDIRSISLPSKQVWLYSDNLHMPWTPYQSN